MGYFENLANRFNLSLVTITKQQPTNTFPGSIISKKRGQYVLFLFILIINIFLQFMNAQPTTHVISFDNGCYLADGNITLRSIGNNIDNNNNNSYCGFTITSNILDLGISSIDPLLFGNKIKTKSGLICFYSNWDENDHYSLDIDSTCIGSNISYSFYLFGLHYKFRLFYVFVFILSPQVFFIFLQLLLCFAKNLLCAMSFFE